MNDAPDHPGQGPAGAPSGPRGRRPDAIRDLLVIVLTLVTGATDAIGFTRLGGVFTSVMTGNLVLLGVSAGRRDGSLALHAGAAFAGYVAGSWVGARVAGHPTPQQTVWPTAITAALIVEFAAFLVFGVWWEVAGGHPSGLATYALIAINAVALGIQSGAVMRFGIPGLSTTYLTGTLAEVVAGSTSRQTPLSTRSVAILVALLAGAGVGGVLTIEVPRAAPAVPLGVLAVVVVGATAAFVTRDPVAERRARRRSPRRLLRRR